MNLSQRYNLYPKLLQTQPLTVVHNDSPETGVYRVEIEYKIDNQHFFVNAFHDKKQKAEVLSYAATLNNSKKERIAYFYNPVFAKKLYEYGQNCL